MTHPLHDYVGALISEAERRNESKAALWRLVILLVLAATFLLDEVLANDPIVYHVFGAYAAVSLIAIGLSVVGFFRKWLPWVLVVLDMAILLHVLQVHVTREGLPFSWAVAAPTMALAFALVVHAGLRFRPELVALAATLFVLGWIAVFGISLAGPSVRAISDAGAAGMFTPQGEALRLAAFVTVAILQVVIAIDTRRMLVSAIVAERARANLSRFFSPDVVESMTRGGSTALRRQQAIILFCDLRGFTRIAETVPMEELAELLIAFRSRVTHAVFAHGGTVDKFIGDGAMAVFVPNGSLDQAAVAALTAALHLQESLASWSAERVARRQLPIAAGIGLNLGEVLDGVIGDETRVEFTVIGDAVNVAERLERLTRVLNSPIVAAAALMDAVGGGVDRSVWEPVEHVAIEGRGAPVDVYRYRAMLGPSGPQA